jgi:hypothetical protein
VLAVSNSADSWAMSSNGGPSWPPFAVIWIECILVPRQWSMREYLILQP